MVSTCRSDPDPHQPRGNDGQEAEICETGPDPEVGDAEGCDAEGGNAEGGNAEGRDTEERDTEDRDQAQAAEDGRHESGGRGEGSKEEDASGNGRGDRYGRAGLGCAEVDHQLDG